MGRKKEKVYDNTVTRDISQLAQPTGNIYESVVIMAKRANQIASELKKELSEKLEEFSASNSTDTLEETFENQEQIEISKHYEKMPKPTLIAIKEFQNGEIYWKKVEEQD